jgi:hypothetical protein
MKVRQESDDVVVIPSWVDSKHIKSPTIYLSDAPSMLAKVQHTTYAILTGSKKGEPIGGFANY